MDVWLEADFYDNDYRWRKNRDGGPTVFPDHYPLDKLPSSAMVRDENTGEKVLVNPRPDEVPDTGEAQALLAALKESGRSLDDAVAVIKSTAHITVADGPEEPNDESEEPNLFSGDEE